MRQLSNEDGGKEKGERETEDETRLYSRVVGVLLLSHCDCDNSQ
jgi:hypothetical protein